jgi:hypothetical protein
MIFFSNKASMHRYTIGAMALLLANSIAVFAETPPPENWYQVEVVLFTHPTNNGDEAIPQDYQLAFSENWRQLAEPEQSIPIYRLPMISERSVASYIANGTAKPSIAQQLATLSTDKIAQITQQVKKSPLFNHIPEASIPYKYQTPTATVSPEIEYIEDIQQPYAQPQATAFVPIYEQPFVKLHPNTRDLNDSARGLDRRGHNVLFHQAWRFQIDSKQQSPWVLIKAGSTATDRYQIEGTLRFYKSRYLHFETDLWRLKFANNISNNSLLLPQIPQQTISEQQTVLLRAISFAKRLKALAPTNQADNLLFDPHRLYNLSALKHLQLDNSGQPPQNTTTDYPISEVWPVVQSKRLQEYEIYYIDHPEMGALVTIKSYTPEPLNQPETEAELELGAHGSETL